MNEREKEIMEFAKKFEELKKEYKVDLAFDRYDEKICIEDHLPTGGFDYYDMTGKKEE